jgi:hypothetical protein
MLLKKLVQIMTTVAILTAINLPAMARPLMFDFTSVLNSAIGPGTLTNAQRTLTGTLVTNNAGQITGAVPTWTLGGQPITNILNVGGSYTPTAVFTPPYTMTSFNMQFTPPQALGITPQISLAFIKYSHYQPLIYAEDGLQNGGTSQASFAPADWPEIDGGVLPKGVFIVIGTFLLLFGRIKRSEA